MPNGKLDLEDIWVTTQGFMISTILLSLNSSQGACQLGMKILLPPKEAGSRTKREKEATDATCAERHWITLWEISQIPLPSITFGLVHLADRASWTIWEEVAKNAIVVLSGIFSMLAIITSRKSPYHLEQTFGIRQVEEGAIIVALFSFTMTLSVATVTNRPKG
jgi:hypothetical protein